MPKDKKDKFDGLTFVGGYTKTTVIGTEIKSTKGKATISIKLVGPGAYLITTVNDDKNTINNLAYLEEGSLYSAAQSGNGLVSTYLKDRKLYHQVSDKSDKVWTVTNYLCKRVNTRRKE